MSATPAAFAAKDNARSTLASSITASSTTIPLATGEGSRFPQPYRGTCTSIGSATTLNSTGISAAIGGSAAIGKLILNFTDGSVAVITAVATDALTTTALLGGTTNTWANTNAWRIDEFVLTLVSAADTNVYEQVRVSGRSTDSLTISAASERGYNGTTAQAFSTNDNVYLFVTAPIVERLRDVISIFAQKLNTVASSQITDETSITNLQTGAYFYVVTSGSANAYVAATPALAAYAAGNIILMKANFSNTGAATINLNSLGAKSIKKLDGVTALAANDIISGQVVFLQYDGTNFQMLSPSGTPTTITTTAKTVYASGTDSGTLSNPTSLTAFDTHTTSISANDLVAGVVYEFELAGTYTWGAGNLGIAPMLGGASVISTTTGPLPTGSGDWYAKGFIAGTAAAGASVAVRGVIEVILGEVNKTRSDYGTANFATNGSLTLAFGAVFSSSNGSNGITTTMCRITKKSATPFT